MHTDDDDEPEPDAAPEMDLGAQIVLGGILVVLFCGLVWVLLHGQWQR
jgi:hypothetical protein